MLKSKTFIRSITTSRDGKPPFLMIAAIGNPQSYANTRHSVGHWIIDRLQENWNSKPFKDLSKFPNGKYSLDDARPDVMLFKSYSYMNLSAEAVKPAWNFISSKKNENHTPVLVVLHDEMAKDVGKIQIRKQMSSPRGHNGLKSLDNKIGGGYTRIGIGIGRPDSRDPKKVANYVLDKIPFDDFLELEKVVSMVEKVIEEMRAGKHIFDANETYKPKRK